MKFNERIRAAREHGGYTQVELARLLVGPKGTNTLVERLENRDEGKGSRYVAQIAHHCRVDPMWLATGDGEMLSPTSGLTQDAALLGLAWQHLRDPMRQRMAHELLSAALPHVPATHPLYRGIERLLKAARKHLLIDRELATERGA